MVAARGGADAAADQGWTNRRMNAIGRTATSRQPLSIADSTARVARRSGSWGGLRGSNP